MYGFAISTILLLSTRISSVSGRGSKHTKRLDREWRDAANHCKMFECAHIDELENDNCVNECTSKSCYDEIYAENPVRSSRATRKETCSSSHETLNTILYTHSSSQEKSMMIGTGNSSDVFVKR